MIITLNEAEQRLAKFIATGRTNAARSNHITDRKMGSQSNEQTDLEGIAAEIAFCKMHNVYPDLNINARPAADCVLPNGLSVDVKATRYDTGRLLAVRWKKTNVDMFALMVGEFPSYRYAGAMAAVELLRDERLRDFGHGLGYAADQSELQHDFYLPHETNTTQTSF